MRYDAKRYYPPRSDVGNAGIYFFIFYKFFFIYPFEDNGYFQLSDIKCQLQRKPKTDRLHRSLA